MNMRRFMRVVYRDEGFRLMPRVTDTDIRTAARMMASDADLCRRFGLTQEQLERLAIRQASLLEYLRGVSPGRPLIERGRAAAVIARRYACVRGKNSLRGVSPSEAPAGGRDGEEDEGGSEGEESGGKR